MIKTLTRHGNSAALIVDKALLDVLRIDLETPLEIVTDGESMIVSPARACTRRGRVSRALSTVNTRH